jgi:glycosyltransferase involved in cell wall biosynthesis
MFIEQSDLISHFSEASHHEILARYPVAQGRNHVVHAPPNFCSTLAAQVARGSRRAEWGFRDDDFVVLVWGRVRLTAELDLIQKGFDAAKVPSKRLLMSANYGLHGSRWRDRVKMFAWKLWLRRRRAVVNTQYLPEEEISRLTDSSDIVLMPRIEGLSSCIPLVAMTFGRAVIAPDHGANHDYFAGSRNFLYQSGNPKSLARQLERAAKLDLEEIGRENAAIAANWSWVETCRLCLEHLDGFVGTTPPTR